MTVQALAQMLIRYEKYCSMTDPVRFAGTLLHQEAIPEYYGMDPTMFAKSPAERAQSLVEKADATDLLTRLLGGKDIDASRMKAVLGVSPEELKAYQDQINPVIRPIPDKTVILTFDDAKKDHATHVAPLLKELGFSATFFITEMGPAHGHQGFVDKSIFMDWDEIRSLHEQGFEIGNHSLTHARPASPLDREDFAHELNGLNDDLEAHGIPRAVSVAYPFGNCDIDQVEVAAQCGLLWGRGNLPEGICCCNGKSIYDPLADDPLTIPSYGDAPLYTYERILERIDAARDGKVLCLAYHGVTDPEEWTNTIDYEAHFRFLAEAGCHCISMGQLSEYIDPVKARAYATLMTLPPDM